MKLKWYCAPFKNNNSPFLGNNIITNVEKVEYMIESVWLSNQGAHSYNVSTSLQTFSLLSETISGQRQRLCTRRQRRWWVVMLSRFWLTSDTHTRAHTLTHNHTTTNSEPFLSHAYTNFYAHSPAHTGTHPDTYFKLCQQKWKYGAHFQGAHLVLKEKSISDVPDLTDWKTSRANSCVSFISEWYDHSSSESTNIAYNQGQRKGIRRWLTEQWAKGRREVELRVNTIIVLLLQRRDSTSLLLW